MAENKGRIRVARGSWTNLTSVAAQTKAPEAGNPVFDKTNNMLYIGDGSNVVNDLICVSTDRLTVAKKSTLNTDIYVKVADSGVDIKGSTKVLGATSITGDTSIIGTITASDKLTISSNGASITGSLNVSGAAHSITGETTITGALTTSKKLTVQSEGASIVGGIDVNGASKIVGNTTITGSLEISEKLTSKNSIDVTGNVVASGYVQASYFNATSDERLKENIIDADINALDIINSIKIKDYNFKDGNTEKQIGIIAQDLEKIDEEKLFIDDSDKFLKIKENKLIYLLWKAVQELSSKVGE